MSDKKRFTREDAREFVDQDYWDRLSPRDKAWLNRFNREYYEGYFPKTKKPLHPKKYHKSINDAANARKRDAYCPVRQQVTTKDKREGLKRNFLVRVGAVNGDKTKRGSNEFPENYNPQDGYLDLIDKDRVGKVNVKSRRKTRGPGDDS